MRFGRTGSNPMFRDSVAENIMLDSKPMSVQGAVNKTLLFLTLVVLCGGYTWSLMAKGFSDQANIIMIASVVIGFILALVTSFKPNIAKFTGTAYALCEGLFLGTVSYVYEAAFNGIVLNAIGITLATLFVMLFLYKTKVIQATEKFKKIILTATLGIALYYLICFIAGLFGHPVSVFNGGMLGIGISLFICAIAAFNFIIDFDFIERGSERMFPDFYEWYSAFGLLVTLIWLYIEVLRLLAQLNSRD